MFAVIVGILVLGLMVLVHEWGHFLVAKLLGIRVDVFSFGFGPRLFGVKKGTTDYRVSALPIGGYVKLAGDNPSEERPGAPDEFLSRPRWQRALVAMGGPTMNLLMAILLLTGLFMYRYERPAFYDKPAVIGGVMENSPAAIAGLVPGDRIVQLDNLRQPRWRDVWVRTAISINTPMQVRLERHGEEFSVVLTPRAEQARPTGFVGWLPYNPPLVSSVIDGTPAARAGLQAGDVLIALNGEPLTISGDDLNVVSERLQALGGGPVELTIGRKGKQQTLTVEPAYNPTEKRWTLGIRVGMEIVTEKLSPWAALQKSVEHTWEMSGWIATLVGRLFRGRASLGSLEGPVGIVRHSSEAARRGLAAVVNLMIIISLSLGLLNLLPIPILDGGHLLVLLIEGSRQRDLSLAVKERLVQVGFVFLMLVFAIVMYNDIARWLGG